MRPHHAFISKNLYCSNTHVGLYAEINNSQNAELQPNSPKNHDYEANTNSNLSLSHVAYTSA